jgi:hypothetical protein
MLVWSCSLANSISVLVHGSTLPQQRPSRVSVQNVDVDEDDEEEEWHLNVEDDDIHDATDINMDETDDAVDVEKNS